MFLLPVAPVLPRTSLKVYSAAMSTQLASLRTQLLRNLFPIETCLGSRYPFDSSCSMCPLPSADSTLNTHSALGQVVVVPPHLSLERHRFPVPLVFLTSCLHSIPCAPCVCACVLCGAGLPFWTCMGHPLLRPEGQGTRTAAEGGTGPARRESKQHGYGDHHQAQSAGG